MPLEYDQQNHGWRCDKHYTLLGIFFSDDELYAFLILEQLLENMDSGLIANELAYAKEKIDRLLASRLKIGVNITDKLRFINISHRSFDKNIFQIIAKAVLGENKLEIDFISKSTQTKTHRVISPQRLVHYKDNWYLDSFCHLRNTFRTFALNGIVQIKTLDECATVLPSIEIDQLAGGSYGIFSGKAKKIAKLHFLPPVSFWIVTEQWYPKQKITQLKNDVLELKIPYNKEQELIADILRYAAHVKVISPASLRQAFTQQAQILLQNNA